MASGRDMLGSQGPSPDKGHRCFLRAWWSVPGLWISEAIWKSTMVYPWTTLALYKKATRAGDRQRTEGGILILADAYYSITLGTRAKAIEFKGQGQDMGKRQ